MNSFTTLVRREFRVAVSPKAQPIWFRVLKWGALIVFTVRYHSVPWFWHAVAVALVTALGLHFFYRWKTRGWSRPWGGWNDVQAADGLR
jgi:hypothetical protein